MFFTYDEAVEWIHARLRLGIKPGLSRMKWMMERLDHPEKKIRSVHIGGTNGKGSTVTFLRTILEEKNYCVGTFTSPYFEQFNERISVNGKPISNKEIVELVNIIKPLSDELEQTELGGPTEFEVITAMSLYYFGHLRSVDIVLYEVGLGGRFDSTNIITPLLSVITSIGLDHTAILGDTHEQIAFEKAGIIKKHVPIITAVNQPGALEVIKKKAFEEHAPIFVLGEQFEIDNHRSLMSGEEFNWKMDQIEHSCLQTSMMGRHQIENAALAIMAAQILKETYQYEIDESSMKQGIKKAYWPGRFEMVSSDPMIIIDGAHNEEGIHTLVREVKKRFSDKEIHIIFSALSDKKLDGMIQELDSIANHITFVSFDFPRAASSKELYLISSSKQKEVSNDWEASMKDKISQLRENQVLIITGSLYFLSEVKPRLMNILETT